MSKRQTRQKQPLEPVGDPDNARGFRYLLQQNLAWLRVHNYSPATIATHEQYVRMSAMRKGDIIKSSVWRDLMATSFGDSKYRFLWYVLHFSQISHISPRD